MIRFLKQMFLLQKPFQRFCFCFKDLYRYLRLIMSPEKSSKEAVGNMAGIVRRGYPVFKYFWPRGIFKSIIGHCIVTGRINKRKIFLSARDLVNNRIVLPGFFK